MYPITPHINPPIFQILSLNKEKTFRQLSILICTNAYFDMRYAFAHINIELWGYAFCIFKFKISKIGGLTCGIIG